MTNTISLDEIPYSLDSTTLFSRLKELPGAAFFDSAHPHSNAGRYDILTACPLAEKFPRLSAGANETQSKSYFKQLSDIHKGLYGGIQPVAQDIPFCGGLLGYLDYDAGCGLNKLPTHPRLGQGIIAHLRAYDWAIVQDHLLRKSVLAALPGVSSARRRDLLLRLNKHKVKPTEPFTLAEEFQSNLSHEEYRSAYAKIQRYIQSGDCYQVNLAQRFSAQFDGDPWYAYQALRMVAASPFSAYLEKDNGDIIMSLSPERFVTLHGLHVETSPIKGTRPRHSDSRADKQAAYELSNSEKDRAENLMIVDLLRNDLGRSCVPGSIHVDRLFELQSFSTVHHLVSTISGELQSGKTAWDLVRDSFPGGSITGAPKRRAMQIISELEPHPRQVYCGSMLYVSADGRMDSNIAIRTLLCQDGEIHCWGGGGIVADSKCEDEYQETYDKIGKFLRTLEEMSV